MVFFLYLLLWVIPGTAALIVSMKIVSHLRGGLDFGDLEPAVFKAAFLLMVSLGVQFFVPYGTWVSLPVWFLGLLLLFRPDLLTTTILALINWYLNLVLIHFLKNLFS